MRQRQADGSGRSADGELYVKYVELQLLPSLLFVQQSWCNE